MIITNDDLAELMQTVEKRRRASWLTELAQLAKTLPADGVQQLRVCRDRFHDPDEVAPLSAPQEVTEIVLDRLRWRATRKAAISAPATEAP